MKRLLQSAALIIICTTLQAQNVSDLPANSFPFNMSGSTVKAFDNRYEGIKGTYTFLEGFKQGSVMLRNTLYKDVLLNYDAVNDLVLIKRNIHEDAFELRKDMVGEFTLYDSGELFHFVRMVKDSNPTYFLELLNSEISVYCQTTKVLQRAEIGGAYYNNENTYDHFKTQSRFFAKIDDDLIEFQPTKRGLTKIFPDKERKIAETLKNNKLNLNNYAQLRALFTEVLSD